MVVIKITGPARKQLREIHDYVKKDSPQNAEHVITSIMARIQVLANFPEIGRPVAISRRGMIRQLHVFKYRIFYVYFQNQVEVLALYHFSMNVDIDKAVIKPFNLTDD
jgi:toxin ParE1/3/4